MSQTPEKRAKKRLLYSVDELLARSFKRVPLAHEWKEHIGLIEVGATFLVWGESASGKTHYVLRLGKALAKAGLKVVYYPLEEGETLSTQLEARRLGLKDVRDSFKYGRLAEGGIVGTLDQVLVGRTAPQAVIIDSLQYSGLTYADFTALRARYPRTIFVLASHADGLDPRGSAAISIKYDVGVKVLVKNFIADARSRYGGGKPLVVSEEKVREMELK